MVSKYFDHICSDLLNAEFDRQKAVVLQRYNYLKTLMPRRESSRRKHPLSRENDIIATVHMRLTLLNLTLGKHVEKNHGCFFAGEVLDEVNRLISGLKKNDLNPTYKITDELFDLSTMAVEYFKDHIEPVLPQALCISEFLEKSMHSTAKINSCVLKETDKIPKPKTPVNIDDLDLKELKKSLTISTRITYKSCRDINSIKLSLKSLNQEITTLENTIYQIKQRQKECKEIAEQEKGNKGIAIPKDDMKELFIKLIRCNEVIDSCESQLYECQRPEPKPISKNSVTVVDAEVCAEDSGTKHSFKNSQNEKIPCGSKSSVPSTNLSSTITQKKEEIIKFTNAPCFVSTRCRLKRKCKIIPNKVLSKKKKQN